MNQEHSLISPSGLYRVFACPASVGESRHAPAKPPSIYAHRGTLQHEGVIRRWKGQTLDPLGLEPDEIANVDDAVDYLAKRVHGIDAILEFEVRGDLSIIGLPQIWGTGDVHLKYPGELHLIDWKFGKGIPVMVDDNEQLMAYLVMALPTSNRADWPEKMFIHLAQPPLDYYGIQRIYPDDIEQFCNRLIKMVRIAESPNAPYNPGEKQCQFCPAAMTCVARFDMQVDTAKEVFSAMEKPHKIVTSAQRAKLYRQLTQLDKFRSELGKQGFEDLLGGREFPGFKLVRGRSTRKWKSEEGARRWLKKYAALTDNDLYEKKMLSPPKVEKIAKKLKKDPDFSRLIDKPPGKVTMVPEDDKREAYNPTNEAVGVFSDV